MRLEPRRNFGKIKRRPSFSQQAAKAAKSKPNATWNAPAKTFHPPA
jgi:hypothetical protein